MVKSINKQEPIVIQGAGLAGSLMALYLARQGYRVEVYERRPDMRTTEQYAGRSINLAISVRGLHAMEEVGLLEEVKKMCIPMRGRVVHDLAGDTNFQPYSKDGTTAINSISRGDLNLLLINEADAYDNIRFHFRYRCVGLDVDTGAVEMRHEATGETHSVQGQVVLACDGAFSGVRYSLQKTPRFNYSQEFHSHAYKELSFPPAAGGGWRVDKHALHIWPRGGYMLIALPNLDGSFTVTLFYPREGEESFATLDASVAEAEAFFRREFPDALDLIPDFAEEFTANPTADLVTVRCSPWVYRDKVALLGDAAHAVVPFYGQGMNAAFEDCTVMHECIQASRDWQTAFERYNSRRVANGQAIATLAQEHYIEMRDSVGDSDWLLRKAIEFRLERTFPERYISLYEMVSFTRTPYAEAMRKGEINEQILHTLAEDIDHADHADLAQAEQLIGELL
ncbi:MAG: NAD(P)/FAD-dependent oxidoreductase [Bacteroidota bacterium]